MATFEVDIPEGIKDCYLHTVRIQFRGTVPEVLGKHDLHRAQEEFGYTVHRWEDTDASGTRVTLTRMDKDAENLWLYATYYYTRVGCKVCTEKLRRPPAKTYATHYVLLVGKGMNTTGTFPLCDEHLSELRKQTRGGRITVHISERLVIGAV